MDGVIQATHKHDDDDDEERTPGSPPSSDKLQVLTEEIATLKQTVSWKRWKIQKKPTRNATKNALYVQILPRMTLQWK